MEFFSPPSLKIKGGGGGGEGWNYYNATYWNLNTMKNNKFKNWSVGIFQFTFGQLVYWSEREKEVNLKESDWEVSIQSSNGLFHNWYFTSCKWLTISVLCINVLMLKLIMFWNMLVWSWNDKSSLGYTLLFTNVWRKWCIMVLLLKAWSSYSRKDRKVWFPLSCNYTMRFIGYDSIETRWFICYRFQIRTIT